MLFTGWIPRGVGKAPEYTSPKATSIDEVERSLRESQRAVTDLQGLLPAIERAKGRIDHFAFGGLTAMQWLRTIGVHTRHHLKIIRAIQRTPGSPWQLPAATASIAWSAGS